MTFSSSPTLLYRVRSWNFLSNSLQNGVFVVFLQGVHTIEQALLLRGKDWFVDRALLSPEPLIQDYVGLIAIEKVTQRKLGKIFAYMTSGGGDYFSIKTSKGSFLLPCEKRFWDPPSNGVAQFVDLEGWIAGAAAYIDS